MKNMNIIKKLPAATKHNLFYNGCAQSCWLGAMICKDFLKALLHERHGEGAFLRQPCEVTRIVHEQVLTAQEDS